MAIAYVDKLGRITETRDELSIGDVPPHKRPGWRPMVGDPPLIDGRTHYLVGPTLTVEDQRVVRTWEIRERPPQTAMPAPVVEPAPQPQVIIQEADTSALEARVRELEAMLRGLASEALKA
jgi:hypothetical protein